MKYNLVKGEILEFAILDDNLPNDIENFNVDIGIRAKINFDRKIVAFENIINYMYSEKIMLKLKTSMFFKIEEDSWDKVLDNGKITIKKNYLQTMGIVTIGASRGILIAKCANTVYSKVIIPQLDINDFLNEDLTFIINSSESMHDL